MDQIVECVPNFSEGRDRATIQALIEAVTSTAGVVLLDHSADMDHHRSVLTFCGTPEAVFDAAMRAVRTATDRIDLRSHTGAHPRVGATDVVPFIPIKGTTMDDCIQLATRLGEQVGRELEIPVFLYERAATRTHRAPLEAVRRGGLEGLALRMTSDPEWAPDFGPPRLHRSAGAIVIGARPLLIAFNVNLRSQNIAIARSIAKTVRQSNGGLPFVKAIGVELTSRGMVQVSMNLTDYQQTPIQSAFQAVKTEAEKHGIAISGSELIGLIPQAAVEHAAVASLQLERFDPSHILERRIATAMEAKDPPDQTLSDFLRAVADVKPTPAGGSVAALVGALAASLGVMGARLVKQSNGETTLLHLNRRLYELVHEDAVAYEVLMKGQKIPKGHPDRPNIISSALLKATEVPLEIAERACEVARVLHGLRQVVKPTVYSDLTVGMILAIATAEAGLFTAQTNVKRSTNQSVMELSRARIIKTRESLEELRRLC
ncbi:MAG TPA: glutamate formimidoyltransferase [Nitrospira sp.]|nr:glutamate formimidoyltransferase [Nitrospira sp.]